MIKMKRRNGAMGHTTLIIFFIMAFVLYVGSQQIGGNTHLYASNFELFMDGITNPSLTTWDLIINQFISPEVIVGAVITAVVASLTGASLVYVLPALALGAVANFFLFPSTFLNTLGLPTELYWLIYGIFQLMLISTLYGFIRGKDL